MRRQSYRFAFVASCGSGGTLREFPTIASSLIWHVEFVDSGRIHQSPTVLRLPAGLHELFTDVPSARSNAGGSAGRGGSSGVSGGGRFETHIYTCLHETLLPCVSL